MTGRGGGRGRSNQVLLPPINLTFKWLMSGARVTVWLVEPQGIRVEGILRASHVLTRVIEVH